jgi:hypothetical protein
MLFKKNNQLFFVYLFTFLVIYPYRLGLCKKLSVLYFMLGPHIRGITRSLMEQMLPPHLGSFTSHYCFFSFNHHWDAHPSLTQDRRGLSGMTWWKGSVSYVPPFAWR